MMRTINGRVEENPGYRRSISRSPIADDLPWVADVPRFGARAQPRLLRPRPRDHAAAQCLVCLALRPGYSWASQVYLHPVATASRTAPSRVAPELRCVAPDRSLCWRLPASRCLWRDNRVKGSRPPSAPDTHRHTDRTILFARAKHRLRRTRDHPPARVQLGV